MVVANEICAGRDSLPMCRGHIVRCCRRRDRRQANVHRTFAFLSSSPSGKTKKQIPVWVSGLLQHRFDLCPHPYRMRPQTKGLSHGLKKCPPDTFLPSLRSGRPFESFFRRTKKEDALRHPLFWYAGRDSNPQPSEPESDALSIEPPAHLLHSQAIIAVFSIFVKRERKNIFCMLMGLGRESGCFLRFSVI